MEARERGFHGQSLARLLLEQLNGLPQIAVHELRVPIDPVHRAGKSVRQGRFKIALDEWVS